MEETKEDTRKIHVKVAAAEVYREANNTTRVGLLGVGGTVLSTIFFSANSWAGGGAAAVISFFLIILVMRSMATAKRLQREYGLSK